MDNFNLKKFLTENKLTKNSKLVKEARVEDFDKNKKAFDISFIDKFGGGDFRILNAETEEEAKEKFLNIFKNNPDMVKSIKSIKPYQVPSPKPKAVPQPGLQGVNYSSIEIDGVDPGDYPDFVDTYITYAEFEDGTPLSDEELEQLQDELYHDGELAQMAADTLYEGKKRKQIKTENKMENFDLKKFLVENKLTTNSRMLKEENELEKGILPYTYLESHKDVTEEYLTQHGLGKYAEQDQEGLGHRILKMLKRKGKSATFIGEMDADNPSDYGAEVYELYDLGDGHIASIDDYTEYLSILKKPTNSRMLKEYIEADEESVAEAFNIAGIDLAQPVYVVEARSAGPGGEQDKPYKISATRLLRTLEKNRIEYNSDEKGVQYDYNAADYYPAKESGLPENITAKLAVMFGDDYEYVIFQHTTTKA